MNDGRSAVLGGSNAVLTTTLARGLRRRGWYVETHEGIEAPDLCVFVPDFGPPAPLIGGDAADWFDTVDSSLTQAFVFAKRHLPPLERSRGGLVFVSSIFGEIGVPNRTAACAAAAGIVGLARSLALEVPSVRTAVVAPALPHPEERWRAPDISLAALSHLEASIGTATLDAVLFLADDLHGHHRGSVLRIPSGVTT